MVTVRSYSRNSGDTSLDAVTSFGGHPLDVAAWDLDAVYSCTQKCLGAPSGLAPVVFSPRALERRVKCRSFYFDLALLEDYWAKRKYHHTMSSTLVYALDARDLRAADPRLEGRVRASGRMGGTWEEPSLTAAVTGSGGWWAASTATTSATTVRAS